jgi:hypothetical protein
MQRIHDLISLGAPLTWILGLINALVLIGTISRRKPRKICSPAWPSSAQPSSSLRPLWR